MINKYRYFFIFIIIIFIISAILYFINFNYHSVPDSIKTTNETLENHNNLSEKKIVPNSTPANPDYVLKLHAAGISSHIPVYSIYNISLYDNNTDAKISKLNECILDFIVSRIIYLRNKKITLLLNDKRDKIYSFNESNFKIETRVVSFTNSDTSGVKINYTASSSSEPLDTITAIARSKDDRLIAVSLKKSGTIKIFRTDNFEYILSIADNSIRLSNIKFLEFDDKNNLIISITDHPPDSTTLYICRANLSYSKLEKINWFSLIADSSIFDNINNSCIYYNRKSGTVFKIDCINAQSSLIMNNPPQLNEKNSSNIYRPEPVQLIKLSNCYALVRNDSKLIKIFNSISGGITGEIQLPSAAGFEIVHTGENYSIITSSDDGTISLLNGTAAKLIQAGRLEGLNIITCIEN